MNYDEELKGLSALAAGNNLPIFDAIITCACEDEWAGVSTLSFHQAQLNTAKGALDAGWHFDKGKAICGECWEAREKP